MESNKGITTGNEGYEESATNTRNFDNYQQAEELYLTAMQRLLNINGWNALTGNKAERYTLRNNRGGAKNDNADEGDFICVQHPSASDGTHDTCLHIERIVTKLHERTRSISLFTRPVELKITGTGLTYAVHGDIQYRFVIQLIGTEIVAGVVVKNEAVEVAHETGPYSNIRQALKKVFAYADSARSHWQPLLKGLLK